MFGNIQAFWGSHIFTASAKHIRSIADGLQLASELDVEEESTTEAQNPLNVKGGNKPREFTVRTISTPLSGSLDPLLEYHQLVRDCGKSLPFIVGYLPFGPLRSILREVFMEDVIFCPSGIVSASLVLDFVEDMPATIRAKEVKEEPGISKAEKKAKAKELNFKFSAGELAEEKQRIGVS